MLRRWLPYILVPLFVAALWWSPWMQQYIDRNVERAVVERYNARLDTTVTSGPHEHGWNDVWFPAAPAVPDTVWAQDGRIQLKPLPDTLDDHAHFGVNDSSGVVFEAMTFIDWLLDADRINAIGMLVLVVGTALAKVFGMFVKAMRRRA